MKKNKIIILVITLILLLGGIFIWNKLKSESLTTPEGTLDAYLTEVQQRPYSFEKAINYVDDTVLDDEFLQSIKEESNDINAPTYNSFNLSEQFIDPSNEEASIEVEFIYDNGYTSNNTFNLKKINDHWKIDLQNVQEEYFSLIDD
ncbi:hypothetical protein KQI76_08630 [Amphibacillus sp. MSJ-3]|uniref:hypothetical protein n=1 Tax=Amphibacillus sp. MSJ-3 TaxID=2841505 RepID=UPI001C0F2E8D|nr:hypothetical protein [Amphibacillus sp. MSJ-3]MBU5595228.1 hypothetical protein [Amphibacillus sp. MSJ-3]